LPAALVSSYSGRSLRAGGATDMRVSGVPWHVIVMQGRWRSDAWKVYFRSSADVYAELLKLQPVALDATRLLAPGALAGADARGLERERLPELPTAPVAPSAAGPAAEDALGSAMRAAAGCEQGLTDAWRAGKAAITAVCEALDDARRSRRSEAEAISLMAAAARAVGRSDPAQSDEYERIARAIVGGPRLVLRFAKRDRTTESGEV